MNTNIFSPAIEHALNTGHGARSCSPFNTYSFIASSTALRVGSFFLSAVRLQVFFPIGVLFLLGSIFSLANPRSRDCRKESDGSKSKTGVAPGPQHEHTGKATAVFAYFVDKLR